MPVTPRRALAPVLVGMALVVPIAAQDWPQWRGPSRDGVAPGFTVPATWPDSLTRRWSVEVGDGYAAPVLVGDRLYVFSRQGGDEVIRALDARTGSEMWRTAYPAPFSFQAAAEPHGPGPKATPAHAGGRIFTLGLGGVVSAFDAATGRRIWHVPEPRVAPLYGTAASPVVEGDVVIVNVGGQDDGALTAYDVATGAVRWSWDGDGPSYASPRVAEIGGVRQVVTLSQDHVIGVSVATGDLLWQRPFTTNFTQNIVDPVVVGDLVVVAGYQEPVSAFRVSRGAAGWTTADVWRNTGASLYMTNGVLVDGALFALSERNSGQYVLIDVQTGETRWAGEGRQAENAAILRSGSVLLVLEEDAELVVGRLGGAGFEALRRYEVADAATWAQPAVSGNRLFVKDVASVTLWTLD